MLNTDIHCFYCDLQLFYLCYVAEYFFIVFGNFILNIRNLGIVFLYFCLKKKFSLHQLLNFFNGFNFFFFSFVLDDCVKIFEGRTFQDIWIFFYVPLQVDVHSLKIDFVWWLNFYCSIYLIWIWFLSKFTDHFNELRCIFLA